MKKMLCGLLIVSCLFAMTACGATKTLHCDGCGKEVHVKQSSNMEESWIIYCGDCEEEFFGDNPVVSEG